MVDSIDPAARSAVMAKVRGKNTRPELIVRKMLFAAGYRYRLHVRKLPGSPDLVFASRKKVIFVHGCFWHRHDDCAAARMPKSSVEFWSDKLNGNKARDARVRQELSRAGWQVLVVWECELGDLPMLEDRLRLFLGPIKTSAKAKIDTLGKCAEPLAPLVMYKSTMEL
jgi:DNA mismatch endonuclease (patch repair protein)